MKYKDPITGEYKELFLKASDTLPIGTIVDYDGDEVPVGYEEVTDVNDYTEEEQVIGTYLGKPLYRKIYLLLNVNENLYDYDLSELNFDYLNIKTAKCSYYNPSGVKFGFFNNYTNNDEDMFIIYERSNSIRILQGNIQIDSSNTNKEIVITLEYTKTTDSEVSD